MVCKECGKLLRENRTECTYCGAPQPNAVPAVNEKKKIKWGWVAAAVVLAIGAAILIMLLLR